MTEAITQVNEQKQDNPRLGILFMIAATFVNSLTAILAKTLYSFHPHEISPIQLMAIESIGCSIINAAIINTQWKYILWDSIESS